jgi:predicted HD superfamily hydrolase involved in NAD metabolism
MSVQPSFNKMISIDSLRTMISNRLVAKGGANRFSHILGVEELCAQLALLYGVDESKARIAALLHDATKYDSEEEHIVRIVRSFTAKDLAIWPKPFWHCLSAVDFAKVDCHIEDEDIQNAIMYHGSARPNMSTLELILYVADYAEPNRSFPNEHIRDIARNDLLAAFIQTLQEIVHHEQSLGHQLMDITLKALAFYQSHLGGTT